MRAINVYIVSEFRLKQKLLLYHVVYNEKISRKFLKKICLP